MRQRLGWVALGVFVVLFVVANRAELPDAWRSVLRAQPGWLVVAVLAMVLWLLNLSLLHAAAQRAAGLPTGRLDLVAPTVGGNALNLVTKSGGMAGLVLFLADARRHGRGRGSVVVGYALAQALAEVAFAATLVAALGLVWVDGRLNRAEIVASGVFGIYLVVRLGVLAAAFRSRDAVRRLYVLPRRVAARLRRRPLGPIDLSGADELHEAMILVRRQPRRAVPVVVHALGTEAIGVVELWGAAAAVGATRSLVVALVGYSVSVLFAIVGFLPGGLGFVEVSLGAVLTSFGASVASATAAVVVYRIVEMWLPLAIGLVVVHRLRRTAAEPS